ncbi:conserved hypothetical protein [Klebsiella quasipneumoniae subsp. similipneumoniae]|nr:conserved hypothetical protein [Klebsiella quasipneumoniae subsp. similipneumoniae]
MGAGAPNFDLIHSPFPVGRYTDCLVCLKDKRQKRLIMTQFNLNEYTVSECKFRSSVQQCRSRVLSLESASQLLKCYVEMVHSRVYTIKKRIQETRTWPAEA